MNGEYKIKGWVARDKSGTLFFFQQTKPNRHENGDYWVGDGHSFVLMNEALCSKLTWEDEPIEVELTIKKI